MARAWLLRKCPHWLRDSAECTMATVNLWQCLFLASVRWPHQLLVDCDTCCAATRCNWRMVRLVGCCIRLVNSLDKLITYINARSPVRLLWNGISYWIQIMCTFLIWILLYYFCHTNKIPLAFQTFTLRQIRLSSQKTGRGTLLCVAHIGGRLLSLMIRTELLGLGGGMWSTEYPLIV